jgi:hypothetical protein
VGGGELSGLLLIFGEKEAKAAKSRQKIVKREAGRTRTQNVGGSRKGLFVCIMFLLFD